MATISFNNGSGVQTLSSIWPTPANRFRGWRPLPEGRGERATAWGDGRMYRFLGRIDYGAHVELHGIARSNDAVVQQFKRWADDGGVFTITTADSESNTYTEVALAPGTFVEIVPELRRQRVITVICDVINVAATPARLRCIYT